MPAAFRIIDTGVREGRANIAFDAALIEERQAGRVPDTIRFLSFPPTVLIGRHQDLSREIDLDYCAKHRIGTVRRPPRGVKKEDYAAKDIYDVWFPNLAPSEVLLKEVFPIEDEKAWKAFKRRFLAEMKVHWFEPE